MEARKFPRQRIETAGLAEFARISSNPKTPAVSLARAWIPLEEHFYLNLKSRLHDAKELERSGEAVTRQLYCQFPHSASNSKDAVRLNRLIELRNYLWEQDHTLSHFESLIKKREMPLVEEVNEVLRNPPFLLAFQNAKVIHLLIQECRNFELSLRSEPYLLEKNYQIEIEKAATRGAAMPHRKLPKYDGSMETPLNAAQSILNGSITLAKYLSDIEDDEALHRYCNKIQYEPAFAKLERLLYRGHNEETDNTVTKWLFLPFYDRGIFFSVLMGKFRFRKCSNPVAQARSDLRHIELLLSDFAKLSPLIVRKVRARKLFLEFNYQDLTSKINSAVFDQVSRLNASFGLNTLKNEINTDGTQTLKFSRSGSHGSDLVAFECQNFNLKVAFLANPGSRTDGYNVLRRELQNRLNEFLKYRQTQNLNALVAVIAQNFSHNIGSHVLVDSEIVRDGPNAERLRSFHHYLQGRMDYIAQLLSENYPQPEPLCLVSDVLGEFFEQSLFLNSLIRDRGFGGPKIRFVLEIHGREILYRWNVQSEQFVQTLRPADPDSEMTLPIVGIPGGRVGRHALYTILENIIRNSAKYGELRDAAKFYELRLRLLPGNEDWHLEVEDNISAFGTAFDNFGIMREGFRQNDADRDGEFPTQGQGLLEIFEAMRFLNGDKKWYPRACDCSDASVCVCDKGCNLGLRTENNLKKLIYRIRISRPRQLAVWSPLQHRTGKTVDRQNGISCFSGLNPIELTRENHHLLLIYIGRDASEDEIARSLGWLATNHWYLPFRILLLPANDNNLKLWEKALSALAPNATRKQDSKGNEFIPSRRIVVRVDSTIAASALFSDNSGISAQKISNDIYRCWLEGFKPPWPSKERPGWHLAIHFERDGVRNTAAERWKSKLRQFTDPYVSLEIGYKHDESFDCYGDARIMDCDDLRPPEIRNALIFGNHGIVPPWVDANTDLAGAANTPFTDLPDNANAHRVGFYQSFSKAAGIEAFQALESPPGGDMEIFRRFIYSIVESCVLNVALFDERVANPLTVPADLNRADDLKRARIVNIISIADDATQSNAFAHDDFRDNRRFDQECLKRAGVHVNTGDTALRFDGSQEPNSAVDVMVLHEGLADEALQRKLLSQGFELACFHFVPFIYRTSGKGPKARRLDPRLAFIESSLVTKALMARKVNGVAVYYINKTLLARGIANTSIIKPNNIEEKDDTDNSHA